MRGYGVRFKRIEAGAYEAVDEDGNDAGGVWRDRFGDWHASTPAREGGYTSGVFTTLKWAKWFVLNNVAKT